MRFSVSMVVLMVAVTGFIPGAVAEEARPPLSPLQAQLQKMQSGESYGMKTVTAPQGTATPATMPKESLNANATALAEKAAAKNDKPPTRLELIQEAYKKAAPPGEEEKTAAARVPETKDKETKEKDAAKNADPADEEVMFETMHADDTPKKPARLIPVN